MSCSYSQHPAITRRQKRTIQRIQQHVKNYRDNPHITLTNTDIREHLYHLEAIIVITADHKVANKAISVSRILKKIIRYRLYGTTSLSTNCSIPRTRTNTRQRQPQTMA